MKSCVGFSLARGGGDERLVSLVVAKASTMTRKKRSSSCNWEFDEMDLICNI